MKKLLYLIFLVPLLCGATDYYVRTDGHDSCDGLADVADARPASCAKKTIQAAATIATTAGDTVNVNAGTYDSATPILTTTASGSEGSPITFKANGIVNITRISIIHSWIIVDGFTILSSSGYWIPGIENGDKDHLEYNLTNNIIQNCTFKATLGGYQSSAPYGLCSYGNNHTIQNNAFDGQMVAYGKHSGDNEAAILTDSNQNWTLNALVGLTVTNLIDGSTCVITENTATTATCTLSGGTNNYWNHNDNYQIGWGFFIAIRILGDDNTIAGNIFKDMADIERLIDVGSSDNLVISDNEAVNIKWSGYWHNYCVRNPGSSCCSGVTCDDGHTCTENSFCGPHPDWLQIVPPSSVTNMQMYGNYLHNSPGMQIGMFDGNDASSSTSYGAMVYNNIFDGTAAAFHYIRDSHWYNNLFKDINSSGNALLLRKGSIGDASGTSVKNNIFWGCGGTNAGYGWYGFDAGVTGTDTDYNFVANADFSAKSGFTGDEAHGISGGNPLFTDAANGDFTMKNISSPAIGAGINLFSIFTDDRSGYSRPMTANWTIGPYEYVPTISGVGTILQGVKSQGVRWQ